jgi:phenylacetate-CoA ligase
MPAAQEAAVYKSTEVARMFFNEEFETLPRPALEALQLKRLQSVLERVYSYVPFYKASFAKAGIRPTDVKSLDDLQRLPFTTKQDMRDSYPYGLFAAPMDRGRLHTPGY